MNFHLVIDHWFVRSFIDAAESLMPGTNKYIYTFGAPGKYLPPDLGIYAPYGSDELEKALSIIGDDDHLYVHWFHMPVMKAIQHLAPKAKLYLVFWGGDFIGVTSKSDRTIHDELTAAYLERVRKLQVKSGHNLAATLRNRVREYRYKLSVELARRREIAARKKFMKRLDFFCHWNIEDMKDVIEEFGGRPQFVPFHYGLDIPELIKKNRSDDQPISIWLGNSDTAANNHLDAIKALSRFVNEPVRVFCPLSYGYIEYGDFISSEAARVFGDKWISLRDFLSLDEYLRLQSSVDIAVMFHNRTQASGNVIALLAMGAKVFVKSQSSLYRMLRSHDILIFDSNTLSSLSFSEFSRLLSPEEKLSNSIKINELFSGEARNQGYLRLLS